MPPYEGLCLTNPVSQQVADVAEVAKSFSQVSALYVINSASPVCPRRRRVAVFSDPLALARDPQTEAGAERTGMNHQCLAYLAHSFETFPCSSRAKPSSRRPADWRDGLKIPAQMGGHSKFLQLRD
ncbi:hypothetical protein C8035_v004678 [Colletotrichum spinosum]|uniref:Uncharacterized protein n=1 Tax=Colletotrichum spinosum TaxID=1347390 RepID=A0A4R8Q7D3_9PEZI|nr:hypothetical protein C8035_v004678 [Colletotrichum spinosum]